MESLRQLYRIGNGPSSSHTIGPKKAAEEFLERNKEAAKFKIYLYGSLAATGRGHLTDKAIFAVLGEERSEIIWNPKIVLDKHPNGLKFESFDQEGKMIESWTVYSIGGGKITDFIQKEEEIIPIYPLNTMDEILGWCKSHGKMFWEYVSENEEEDIFDYLNEVWKVMKNAVERGIEAEGSLPGGLNIARKASSYYVKASSYRNTLKRRSLTYAYALAVSEENATGGQIVTAPTCGSSGVIPGVFYVLNDQFGISDKKIIKGLATSGLIGNLVKKNASISGAEVGCQGEIGTACAMASGGATQIFGGTPMQIEYSASIGLEHFLGLTCDPIAGLVQVPCIERNAMGAARALDSNLYAILSDGNHFVSFDTVVKTMNQTGHDLPSIYRETAEGGLAKYGAK